MTEQMQYARSHLREHVEELKAASMKRALLRTLGEHIEKAEGMLDQCEPGMTLNIEHWQGVIEGLRAAKQVINEYPATPTPPAKPEDE